MAFYFPMSWLAMKPIYQLGIIGGCALNQGSLALIETNKFGLKAKLNYKTQEEVGQELFSGKWLFYIGQSRDWTLTQCKMSCIFSGQHDQLLNKANLIRIIERFIS